MSQGEKIFWGAFALLVIAGLAAALIYRAQNPVATQATSSIQAPPADPSGLPGLMATNAPWDANLGTLSARMDAFKFPKLSMEGAAMHIHQNVSIFIDGERVSVPQNIGIAGFFSPIHTHDATGIVHVEAPFVADFSLGHFFDVWGVRFTNECIGTYCENESKQLRVYVNGEEYTGDFRTLTLKSHDVYAIVYGALPGNIPSSYAFPAGY